MLGDEQTIRAITVDDLHGWLRTQYRPEAAGPGRRRQARSRAARRPRRGGVRRHGGRPIAVEPEPAQFIGGRRFERRKGEQAHIALAMAAPQWGAPDAYASQLFADVVGAGILVAAVPAAARGAGPRLFGRRGRAELCRCGHVLGLCRDRPRRCRAGPPARSSGCSPRPRRASSRASSSARAPLAKAGMMMSLESCWGQASYLATRLLRDGGLVEPSEIVARLDRVTRR